MVYTMRIPRHQKDVEALKHIRNFSLSNGRVPSTRELMKLMGYRSPRSAALIVNRLAGQRFLKKGIDGSFKVFKDGGDVATNYVQTVKVPLVGVVACGKPIIANENLQGFFAISTDIARPPHKYFILRAQGDSMNLKEIFHGDMLLIRQQYHAEKGDVVVALIDDEATVKDYQPFEGMIALLPRSTSKKHAPIIVKKNFLLQGVFVTKLPKVTS